jgi:hypothetical protein
MTLYIALGTFWLYCAFSDKYRDAGMMVLAVCSLHSLAWPNGQPLPRALCAEAQFS